MFLLSVVAFWQVSPAANIRRLMRIAGFAFGIAVVMNVFDDWYPIVDQTSRVAWIALNNCLSMAYFVAFLLGISRVGRFVNDSLVTRSANVAAWTWGISGTYLLALLPNMREQIAKQYTPEGRPWLIASLIVMGILMLIGLMGMIRALWHLKKIASA